MLDQATEKTLIKPTIAHIRNRRNNVKFFSVHKISMKQVHTNSCNGDSGCDVKIGLADARCGLIFSMNESKIKKRWAIHYELLTAGVVPVAGLEPARCRQRRILSAYEAAVIRSFGRRLRVLGSTENPVFMRVSDIFHWESQSWSGCASKASLREVF